VYSEEGSIAMLASNPSQTSYFETKSMSIDMVELGESVRQHLRVLRSKDMSCGKTDLEQKCNTATALLNTGEVRYRTARALALGWISLRYNLECTCTILQPFGSII
jgi:hypothetical protein